MFIFRIFLPLIVLGMSGSSGIPHNQHVDEVSNYLRTETGSKNIAGHTFTYEHVTSQKIITGCEGSKSASGEMKIHFYFIDATGKKQSVLSPYDSFDVVMPSPDALPEFLRTKKLFMHDLCFPEACEAGPCGTPLKTAEWRIPSFPWFSSWGKAGKDEVGASLNAEGNGHFHLGTGTSGASIGASASTSAEVSVALPKDSTLVDSSVVTTTTNAQSSSGFQANESQPAPSQPSADQLDTSIVDSNVSNSSVDDIEAKNPSTSGSSISYTTVTTSTSSSSSSPLTITTTSCDSSSTPTPTCGCCEHCPAYKAIEQLILAKLESQFVHNPWPFPTIVPSSNTNFPWSQNSPPVPNRERTEQLEPTATWPFNNLSPQPKLAKETADPSLFASLPGAIRGQAPVIYYPSCDPDAFYQPAIINYCTDYSDTPSGDFQQDLSPQLNASKTLVTPN